MASRVKSSLSELWFGWTTRRNDLVQKAYFSIFLGFIPKISHRFLEFTTTVYRIYHHRILDWYFDTTLIDTTKVAWKINPIQKNKTKILKFETFSVLNSRLPLFETKRIRSKTKRHIEQIWFIRKSLIFLQRPPGFRWRASGVLGI